MPIDQIVHLSLDRTGTTRYPSTGNARILRKAVLDRERLMTALHGGGPRSRGAARRLSRCGRTASIVRTPEGERRYLWGCDAAFCHYCNLRKRRRLYVRLEPWVSHHLGLGGCAALLTVGFGASPETGRLPIFSIQQPLGQHHRE